jgi:ATP-dependent DNA helicase RecQ
MARRRGKTHLRRHHGSGERFGAAHIADILLGKASEKVMNFNHQALPMFGKGAAHSRSYWQSFIRQMVGGGLLTIDVAGFGGLSLSAKGRAVRGRHGSLSLPARLGAAGAQGQAHWLRGGQDAAGADPRADALLARLKALRLRLAKARGVAAYIIFSDRSLIDMAQKMPLTKWDFGEVNGVGASKLEQFGEIFLEEIRAFAAETAPQR